MRLQRLGKQIDKFPSSHIARGGKSTQNPLASDFPQVDRLSKITYTFRLDLDDRLTKNPSAHRFSRGDRCTKITLVSRFARGSRLTKIPLATDLLSLMLRSRW